MFRAAKKLVSTRGHSYRFEELELLYRSVPLGLGMVDRELRFVHVNQSLAEFAGFSPDQMLGRTTREIVPELASKTEPIYHRVFDTGEPVLDVEVSGPTRAQPGRGRDWLASYSPVEVDDEIVGVSIVVQDVTESKRTAEDLRKAVEKTRDSESFFRHVAENVPAIFTYLGPDLRYRYSNRHHRKVVGRRAEEIVGRSVEEVLGEKTASTLRPNLDRCLTGEEVHWEFQLTTPAGLTRWFMGLNAPEVAGDGSVTGIFGFTADISHVKETEEKLRQALAENERLRERLEAENVYLREEVARVQEHADFVGESPGLLKVLQQAEQVAGTNSTVLVRGETGTGKDLVAAAIHGMSARKDRTLVKVNCAALPATLIESELFGREKGAYTGAIARHVGRFELADGSTLFLDEVSELPVELQPKLLRVLQDGEFERLGSSRTLKVDVRIIAATNRDLGKAVREGGFREDLYYRLNVFPITVPPLRERRDDIPRLVWAFVKELSEKMGKKIDSIPRKTMEELQSYPWPGNVRELRNVVERAMIVSLGPALRVELGAGEPASAADLSMDALQRRHIVAVLKQTGGRVRGGHGAAEILGLKPTTLESRMAKLGITDPP